MPCDTMISNCLLSGTSHKEHGIGVSVQPKSGEKWQFYVIDEKSNAKCTLRKDLEIHGALCDVVVICNLPKTQAPIVCLVELKGCDYAKAVEQVINTYKSLFPHFQRKHSFPVCWRVFIRRRGGAPKQRDLQLRKRLVDAFGKGNFQVVSGDTLAMFLRRSA